MKTKRTAWLGPIVAVLLFSLAMGVLHHALAAHHLKDILHQIKAIPLSRVTLALILTLLGYGTMTVYDLLALRYLRQSLAYAKIAMAAFVGAAFSNNIGLSMIAGASVRYRLYSAWGLSALEITKLVFFCTITLWLGFLTTSGTVFILHPLALPAQLHLPGVSTRPIGFLMGLAVAVYLLVGVLIKSPLRLREWEVDLPGWKTRALQTVVGAADWLLAGGVLAVLLPPQAGTPTLTILGIYMLAQLAGLISQVPGGLGVFETVFMVLIGGRIPTEVVLGALFVFRLTYYLLPLALSTILLAGNEVVLHWSSARRFLDGYRRWSAPVVPPVLAFSTFAAGAVLLFSGATPALDARMFWLREVVPLSLLELAHFAGSTIGMILLLVARGLQRRLNGAYWASLALLTLGMVASLVKGLDYEEALLMVVLLVALWSSRRYFYRRSSLLDQRFTPAWIAAIAMVMITALWLGFFSYKHVTYSGDLWWQFTFHAHAPRFLRASAGAAAVLFCFFIARLLRPAVHRPAPASDAEWQRVAEIVRRSPATSANLALLGDKSFIISPNQDAFIMYAVQGRSWIAMGDPVGPDAAWSELIWRFREQSDRFGGWTLFYQVAPAGLPYYLDLGLTLTKLGETARVRLDAFSLEGSHHKGLRSTKNKLEKAGCHLEILQPEEVMAHIDGLRHISDSWLAEKNSREKGFSLGWFDEGYLSRFDMAVIKQDDAIVAFANLWQGAGNTELSIDLMRYDPATAPNGVMDFLFIQLLLWAKQQGYAWFDLGMAPLSGLADHSLAPLWNRLGTFLAHHAGHFYNFDGLRQYKDKFGPVWEPRYLASPGGLALPMVLTHLVQLISGGGKSGSDR